MAKRIKSRRKRLEIEKLKSMFVKVCQSVEVNINFEIKKNRNYELIGNKKTGYQLINKEGYLIKESNIFDDILKDIVA